MSVDLRALKSEAVSIFGSNKYFADANDANSVVHLASCIAESFVGKDNLKALSLYESAVIMAKNAFDEDMYVCVMGDAVNFLVKHEDELKLAEKDFFIKEIKSYYIPLLKSRFNSFFKDFLDKIIDTSFTETEFRRYALTNIDALLDDPLCIDPLNDKKTHLLNLENTIKLIEPVLCFASFKDAQHVIRSSQPFEITMLQYHYLKQWALFSYEKGRYEYIRGFKSNFK